MMDSCGQLKTNENNVEDDFAAVSASTSQSLVYGVVTSAGENGVANCDVPDYSMAESQLRAETPSAIISNELEPQTVTIKTTLQPEVSRDRSQSAGLDAHCSSSLIQLGQRPSSTPACLGAYSDVQGQF